MGTVFHAWNGVIGAKITGCDGRGVDSVIGENVVGGNCDVALGQ